MIQAIQVWHGDTKWTMSDLPRLVSQNRLGTRGWGACEKKLKHNLVPCLAYCLPGTLAVTSVVPKRNNDNNIDSVPLHVVRYWIG